ncbi:hypothetical protein L6R49_07300 [Myxococcota bacterium]|nr:hypothetical protein [Myxococcota bacterium]
MRLAFAPPLVLLACAPQEGPIDASGEGFAAFIGEPDTQYELIPEGLPDEVPGLLRTAADQSTWTFRLGERWADATPAGEWTLSKADGLRVAQQLLLPKRVKEGESQDGVTVVSVAEREVWYGIFPSVATVEVESGVWAGEHAFAAGVGPILLTIDGVRWELAGYEGL